MGYDIDGEYVQLAEKRIRESKQQLAIPLFVEKDKVTSSQMTGA